VNARGPFVVLLAVCVSGAVVASEAGDETPTIAPTAAEAGVHMPAAPPDDVLASTWYCAAGTAEAGALADHTVVIVNPGGERVTGTVGVHPGDVAPPAADPMAEPAPSSDSEDDTSDEEAAAEDSGASAGFDGLETEDVDRIGEDGPRVAGWVDEDARRPQQEDGDEGEDESGEDEGGEDDGRLGDAWPSGGGEAPDDAGATGPVVAREDVRVPAGGRVEVHLADVQPSPLAAALVELDGPAIVEHRVTGPAGRDVAPCASAASPEWHLAWGATTRDARELLVLFNPFPSSAAVDIVFSTDDGEREPLRYQGFPVPAGGVVGLDIGDEVTRRAQVSATVRSRSGPIVVERLQTFDGSEGVAGLSVALAAPAPLEAWTFAHGRVGSSRGERIVVYNPTEQRAEVEVGVRPAEEGADPAAVAAAAQPFGVSVPPGRYEILDFAEEERVPRDVGHATVIRSTNGVPIVAERVLDFARRGGGDLAAGSGSPFAARSWTFATTGGEGLVSRFVAYNPDPDRPARLSLTALVDGERVAPDELQAIEVPPGSRHEVRLTEDLEAGDPAVVVESDVPVVVERFVSTAGGLGQAAGPGLPAADTATALTP
jgi:hypothetical protein